MHLSVAIEVMEDMEGMLRKLKFLEAKRKGVQIGGHGRMMLDVAEVWTVGTLMSEKPVPAEAIEQVLGKIWCPIKGIECKDLGENHFLFTFHQRDWGTDELLMMALG